MREELEQFRKTNAEQSDKLLAYETYVSSVSNYMHCTWSFKCMCMLLKASHLHVHVHRWLASSSFAKLG